MIIPNNIQISICTKKDVAIGYYNNSGGNGWVTY